MKLLSNSTKERVSQLCLRKTNNVNPLTVSGPLLDWMSYVVVSYLSMGQTMQPMSLWSPPTEVLSVSCFQGKIQLSCDKGKVYGKNIDCICEGGSVCKLLYYQLFCEAQCNRQDVQAKIEDLHAELDEKTLKIWLKVDTEILIFYTNTTPSKNIIKKLSIKLGEYFSYHLDAEEALIKLKQAWSNY